MFYDKRCIVISRDGDFFDWSVGMCIFIFVVVDYGVDFVLIKLR